VEQKMKEIQCNIVSFNQAQPGIATASTQTYSFRCEEIRNINSIEADKYIESLLIAQKQNKCRSLLFYGPPGTGKSTIINNIVTKLNYRTLVINFNEITDYNMVLFVIDNFKFEAIVIDDFDLADKSANILKFLEDVRTKVKVVLGSANSLKSIYPALIRPGRFDEVIKIENLSEKTIRHIVGDMEIDFDRIKHWPVAYINELIYRIQLTGNLTNLEHDLVELNTRVSAQLESLKM
jgi:SpoVK/Ycf46/Vps4 family AAA+-type ATPase